MTEDKKKEGLPDSTAAIIAAVIGAVSGIIIALIGVGFFPFLNPGLQDLQNENAELKAQLSQTISAPKNSDTWTDQNGNKHRYWVCQGFTDWEKAKTFCESLGGHLATITSADEQAHIGEYVKTNAPKVKENDPPSCLWIGIQANNANWNQWVNNEAFNYANWNDWYPGTRGVNNYSVFSNSKFPQYVTLNGTVTKSHEVNIGEWLLVSDNEKSGYNPDGWLICEWDY